MVDVITQHIDVWTSVQMTKSTAGRGTNGKQTAYGIKKLRELILELAVRGLLVPQDPNDEPASVLLEKIAEEKARLVKEGNIKKQTPLPEIGEDEKPFALPNGWMWVKLDDIGSTSIGLTYSPKDVSDKGIPVLRSSNIQGGKIDLNDLVRVDVNVKSTLLVEQGDLLICARNGSKALVGKTAMIKNSVEKMTFGAFMAIYRSECNAYVEVFLNSPIFRNLLEGVSTTTINQITQANLKSSLTPLPPLAEQHRIVAKVDELMALCDRLEEQQTDSNAAHQTLVEMLLGTLTNPVHPELVEGCSNREQCPSTGSGQTDFETNSGRTAFEAAWQRIAEHFDTLFTTEHSIDQLKQTILQLAVMGKLVPQNPNDEPASVLLEKIADEKARLVKEGKIKKQTPLPEISDDKKPFDLPNSWKWFRLGEIVSIRGGKRVSNGYPLLSTPTPYIYIRVSDMNVGTIDDSDLKYIDEEMYSKISQYIITKDDIYMTIVGATIGKCGLVPDKFDGVNLTENAARLTPILVSKYYLYKVLSTPFCQNQFIDKTKQVGVQKMALIRLASTLIPLPPLAEQHRIVAKVDELMTLCDTLKARIKQAQTTQIHLADTIVEQAVA